MAGVSLRAGPQANWPAVNRTLPGCFINILHSIVAVSCYFYVSNSPLKSQAYSKAKKPGFCLIVRVIALVFSKCKANLPIDCENKCSAWKPIWNVSKLQVLKSTWHMPHIMMLHLVQTLLKPLNMVSLAWSASCQVWENKLIYVYFKLYE